MKILMFEPDVYCTERGGDSPSIHLRELSSHLRKEHDVTVIARRPRGSISPGRSVRLIRGIPLPFLATPTYAFTGFLKGLWAILRNRPDVIYSRHHVVGTGIILGRLFRVPVVSEINGMLIDEAEACRSYGRVLRWIARLIERVVLKGASRIVAVSPGVKAGLMKRHRIPLAKIAVVENGANTDMFHPDVPRDGGDVLRVGFSGSFNAWHGVEELLRSIPHVLEEFRNVRFVFLGDGPLKKRAVRLAGELGLGGAVEFADRVPYEDAAGRVASFDVGVILKKKDIPGSPLKLWEYMAAGKPVVATDSNDFSVLRERNAGLLTDPEKPEEVARAILSLLRDEALRKKMGTNGSRYVSENRSWKHVADEVAGVLRETR